MYRGDADGGCRARAGARCDSGEPRLTVSVSLLVPGLAADFGGYADDVFPPAPALSTWTSRARVSGYAAALTEQAVSDLTGIAAGDATPVAALSYLQDFGELPPSFCLRADPVHLRADTNGLVLFDAASFELDDDDSRALVETLAAQLAADGWQLRQGHRSRWYLLGEQAQDLTTTALPQQRGTLVAATPFSGRDAATWMARLNELQMLMHDHPVNQARAARGEVVVNSVWPWGAGNLTVQGDPLYTRLSADNVCARGAARWRGITATALVSNAEQFLSSLVPGEQVLLVLEACRAAAAYEDFGAWQSAVEQLEKDWLAPLVGALKAGRLDKLDLLPLNGSCYRLERRRLKLFWKRIRDYRRASGFRRTAAGRT